MFNDMFDYFQNHIVNEHSWLQWHHSEFQSTIMPADNIVTALPAVVHPVSGNGYTNGGAEFYKTEVTPMAAKNSKQR